MPKSYDNPLCECRPAGFRSFPGGLAGAVRPGKSVRGRGGRERERLILCPFAPLPLSLVASLGVECGNISWSPPPSLAYNKEGG